VFELERPVSTPVLAGEGFPELMGATEHVRIVRTAVVPAGHAELLPERPDFPKNVDTVDGDSRRHRDPGLANAELRRRGLVSEQGRVGEVVSLQTDRAPDLVVAIAEKDLRPSLLPLARVVPGQVLVVGDVRRVEGRAALPGCRAVDAVVRTGRAAAVGRPQSHLVISEVARRLRGGRHSGRARRPAAHADTQRGSEIPAPAELPVGSRGTRE
jgi:hypothetical protein